MQFELRIISRVLGTLNRQARKRNAPATGLPLLPLLGVVPMRKTTMRLDRLRAVEDAEKPEKPMAKPPQRPAQCRTYLRQRLTEALPKIVDDFVENGRYGSAQRLKFVAEMLGKPEKAKRAAMGTRTLSRWAREMREGR